MSGEVLVREVPASDITMPGLGVVASTPAHNVITWGEHATSGEADGEIRVFGAVDEGGNDITGPVTSVVMASIRAALADGVL